MNELLDVDLWKNSPNVNLRVGLAVLFISTKFIYDFIVSVLSDKPGSTLKLLFWFIVFIIDLRTEMIFRLIEHHFVRMNDYLLDKPVVEQKNNRERTTIIDSLTEIVYYRQKETMDSSAVLNRSSKRNFRNFIDLYTDLIKEAEKMSRILSGETLCVMLIKFVMGVACAHIFFNGQLKVNNNANSHHHDDDPFQNMFGLTLLYMLAFNLYRVIATIQPANNAMYQVSAVAHF